ncbi:GNAT family N-acetyltransferase [Paenibacillus crassostreae]|uniref:N-acetyltransferase domain-containing protein n=1 Tax=Paenibacillus crassostreae TaxID=1763538 RepID=A0A167BVE3_9BACL|nr:GNAT family N-acetyltransferase [Paenibacillus crassostreae]AOZ92536.1 hypothetical protein LPB68_10010 [Paenibacillus crassostreae]OAB72484.1 hypothetical protein PNBC_16455 [Paenibacillus crassostreae]
MEFRLIREHELKEAAFLAEEVFCDNGERYMEYSFPSLFRPGVSHSYAAFSDQGKLVSFIGMVPVMIHSGKARISAYSIGAVCTEQAYRGQGIARKLLTLCQQHAKEAGASLMFISGDIPLYTKAGSMTFGKSEKYSIHANAAEQLENQPTTWTYSEMEPQDLFAIHALILQNPAAIQWGITELAQFIGASPMANIYQMNQYVRVARTSEQEIVAIAVFAIPRVDSPDRAGMLVEYAGLPSAVTALISHSFTQFEIESLSVTIPWQDKELANLLQSVHANVEQQANAGTVLIVDGATLITQAGYDISTTNETAISILPDGRYKLHTQHKSSVIGGNPELCSLLFNPDSDVDQLEDTNLPTIALPYMYGLYFI